MRTCWHCWGLSLTCKINFKFILSVVFNKKYKQVGSFCNVLEQDLLLTVIGCQGFTLLVNHKYFLTRLCHFQWNLLLILKADLNWTLVSLTFNLIFIHGRICNKKQYSKAQIYWHLDWLDCVKFRTTKLLIPKLVQRTKKGRLSFSSMLEHQELKFTRSGVF